ncbi:MAG: HAD family hydrolase [Kofleriaceae bacterium]|nr:HAD family hydrolase [Kofleriaceae bacterium]MCL4227029.1 HAD family hydrolase [Myxococcales bacterium]
MTAPSAPSVTSTSTRPVVILDFDGTMTDAEAEGEPFVTGYLEDLEALVGADTPARKAEVAALVAEVRAELLAAPEAHPFRWKGKAVAPASVDPYLRMVPIADRIFDRHDAFANRVDRGRLTGGVLYKHNYARTKGKPVFRPGAAEVIAALAGTETFVVTNSHTASVADKIRILDERHGGCAWLAARVHGEAQKFEVDDAWDAVPAELTVPGLAARNVLLRRRHYHDRLAGLLAGVGARFADMLVVGDIFELDLALPLALGARVALVQAPHTPPYEVAFVAGHPRGTVVTDLRDVLRLLE